MRVTDEAITKIKEFVVSGRLLPGQRLPPEGELATQLGISRNSLREAVRALSLLGVLDVRHGDGTYVGSLEPGQLLDVVGFVVDLLEQGTVVELVQARRLLEAPATALAAEKVTHHQLGEIRALMDKMSVAETVQELVEADAAFHDAIVRVTGNRVVTAILRGLGGQTIRARVWHGLADEGALAQTHAGHEAIYDALRRRDQMLAYAAALNHIATTENWLRDVSEGSVELPAATVDGLRERS